MAEAHTLAKREAKAKDDFAMPSCLVLDFDGLIFLSRFCRCIHRASGL